MDNEKKLPTEDVDALSRHASSVIKDQESQHMSEEHKNEAIYSEQDVESQRNSLDLHQIRSHMSTHDATPVPDFHHEEGDEVYNKFTSKRKNMIVSVLSFCSFLAPMSSTSILSASPEVSPSPEVTSPALTPFRLSVHSTLRALFSTSQTPCICFSWV